MEYEAATVERVVDRAMENLDDCDPAFYAVTGSHIYGFPGADGSDVDVRGFHVADGSRYALLDRPEEQVIVNQDGVTEGFEDVPHVDFVSYELRKFGKLVYDANFNALETVFCADVVVDDVPEDVRTLRSLVEEYLPLDVPSSYYGMARHNYRKHLAPERDGDARTAKTYLYVLRGLLAAQYVRDRQRIEADVCVLADEVLGKTGLVEDLIAVKRDDETAGVSGELAARADEQITALFDEIDVAERVERSQFRDAVDDWMRTVRD